jgi:hypothetical protein
MIHKENDINGLAVIGTITSITPFNRDREIIYVGEQVAIACKNDFYIGEKVIVLNHNAQLPELDIFKDLEKTDYTVKRKIKQDVKTDIVVLPLTVFEHVYYGYKYIETPLGNKQLQYLWKHFPNGSRQEVTIEDGKDIGRILCIKRKLRENATNI